MSDVKTEAQEAQPQGLDLTLNDLGALRTIIDVASQRGAFKPAEMESVGRTYNKLAAFLDAVAKQAQAATEAPKEKEGA